MTTRWCRIAAGVDLAAVALSRRHEFPDGTLLVECEFTAQQLELAQAAAGVTVLPSLSTPAERLGAGVRAWLEAQGVTIEAGDQVLNLLRKLRDAKGTAFSVDLPY